HGLDPQLNAHLAAHRSIAAAFDRLNGDILSPAGASVMTFITPYNIYLLTAILFAKFSSSTSGLMAMMDQVGVVLSLVYQIVVISLIAFLLCRLVDRLHESAKAMHGQQLWLVSSDRGRHLRVDSRQAMVSLHTKWKLAAHYEAVHTDRKHHFTVGTMVLSKQ